MATSPRVAMRAVRNLYGTIIPREEFKEAASETFKLGAVLTVNASGYIAEAGADPTLIIGLATKEGQNGASAGDKAQPVEMALPGILFMGNMANAGDTAVTAQTDVGQGHGIAKDATSGKWYVDKDDTTAKRVMIWNFWLQDNDLLGDTRGRVIFAFDPTYCQGIKI